MLAGHVHLDGALDLLRTGILFDDVDLERLLLQCSRTLRLKSHVMCRVTDFFLLRGAAAGGGEGGAEVIQ